LRYAQPSALRAETGPSRAAWHGLGAELKLPAGRRGRGHRQREGCAGERAVLPVAESQADEHVLRAGVLRPPPGQVLAAPQPGRQGGALTRASLHS
jgi:hypothetical protein